MYNSTHTHTHKHTYILTIQSTGGGVGYGFIIFGSIKMKNDFHFQGLTRLLSPVNKKSPILLITEML